MDIKALLIERQQMSLVDLARHFYVNESVMQGMLDHWIKKGRLEKIDLSGTCGTGCGSCNEAADLKQIYRWKSVAQKPISVANQ